MVDNKDIKQFYENVCSVYGNNYKIILEPGRNLSEDWVEYDLVEWKIEKKIKNMVKDLKNNFTKSIEEKIFDLYIFICMNYIYDVNVLYFFRKDVSNPNNIKYVPVDWYGRIVSPEWFEKRQKHNRRICYEFSRFYAKAINELIDNSLNVEAVIVGDKDNTHYVVGLIGQEYNIILDQDDFNNIKDLTRVKLNLSIKGIHILKDKNGKFEKIVNEYNKDKLEDPSEITQAKKQYIKNDIIKLFNKSINILKEYNIDSQGFFEYMRYIIEEANIKIEKLWKIDTRKTIERRHERCLYFSYKNITYLLDSIEKNLKIVDITKLDNNLFIFKPEENEYKYYGS